MPLHTRYEHLMRKCTLVVGHDGGIMNNQRIAIITDSGTDVPAEYARDHDIIVVPLRICYSDGTTYESGVDIQPADIIKRFEEEIPTTSLPSPQAIQQALELAQEKGYTKAVLITLASKLSATFETMCLVANQMEDFPTLVFDTKNVGMAAGLTVQRACEMVESGVAFEDLEAKLEAYATHTKIFFCARTLDYVYKGGRINKAMYRISQVLNIKPILTCDETGAYTMSKKARGWEKALDTLGDLIEKYAKEYGKCRVSVCTTMLNDELFDMYKARFEANIPDMIELSHVDITAELLVHTGPELIGVGVQKVIDE